MRTVLAFITFLFCAIFPFSVLAGEPIDPAVSFPWIYTILDFIAAIPSVGPVMQTVILVIGVVSGIFTALAACFDAICKVLSVFSKLAGATAIAAKVMEIHAWVSPWLKYFSAYNVQKK